MLEKFEKSDPSLQKIIISLLDQETYVRPQDITSSTISLLKAEITLNKYLQPNDVKLSEFELLNVTSNLSNIPLLLKLMSVCPITDLRVEKLLVKIRAKILTSIKDLVTYAYTIEHDQQDSILSTLLPLVELCSSTPHQEWALEQVQIVLDHWDSTPLLNT